MSAGYYYLDSGTGLGVVLEDEGDGWLVAHVPDLPGCISQGATFAEAVENIRGAILDYLDILEQDNPAEFASLTSGTGLDALETVESTTAPWAAVG